MNIYLIVPKVHLINDLLLSRGTRLWESPFDTEREDDDEDGDDGDNGDDDDGDDDDDYDEETCRKHARDPWGWERLPTQEEAGRWKTGEEEKIVECKSSIRKWQCPHKIRMKKLTIGTREVGNSRSKSEKEVKSGK